MLNQRAYSQNKKARGIGQNTGKGWGNSKSPVLPLKTSGNRALSAEVVVESLDRNPSKGWDLRRHCRVAARVF